MDTGGGAPTGCYKCGRPGHWSRDCPSNPDDNKDLQSNPTGTTNYPKRTFNSFKNSDSKSGSAAEKPKRIRSTRPKLTPDLLMSNDGLGHILRYFPRAFSYHGRGHEVSDLGHLLGMYAEWHSRLLPYFSFDQFVHKVEQIGTKARVKKCIQELRERVATGVDPTKLHEPLSQEVMSNHDPDVMDSVEQNPSKEKSNMKDPETDDHQENILCEMWEKTMEEPSVPTNDKAEPAHVSSGDNEAPDRESNSTSSSSNGTGISEEQRARMQANRLKALEKFSEEQRARMQANRLKALEKAAARAQKSQ